MIQNKKCPQCIGSKINESFYRSDTKLNNYWIRSHLSKHSPSFLYDYIQYVQIYSSNSFANDLLHAWCRKYYVSWYENQYQNETHLIPKPPKLPQNEELTKAEKTEERQKLVILQDRVKFKLQCESSGNFTQHTGNDLDNDHDIENCHPDMDTTVNTTRYVLKYLLENLTNFGCWLFMQ